MDKRISEKELTVLLRKSVLFDSILAQIDYNNKRDLEIIKPILQKSKETDLNADIFFMVKGYPDAWQNKKFLLNYF